MDKSPLFRHSHTHINWMNEWKNKWEKNFHSVEWMDNINKKKNVNKTSSAIYINCIHTHTDKNVGYHYYLGIFIIIILLYFRILMTKKKGLKLHVSSWWWWLLFAFHNSFFVCLFCLTDSKLSGFFVSGFFGMIGLNGKKNEKNYANIESID